MSNQRDYNVELKEMADHQYAYSFDFEVMNYCMIRSFEPFINKGSLLELGRFKDNFIKRFLSNFCVEAFDDAIEEARRILGGRVKFVNSLFMEGRYKLGKHYSDLCFSILLICEIA